MNKLFSWLIKKIANKTLNCFIQKIEKINRFALFIFNYFFLEKIKKKKLILSQNHSFLKKKKTFKIRMLL